VWCVLALGAMPLGQVLLPSFVKDVGEGFLLPRLALCIAGWHKPVQLSPITSFYLWWCCGWRVVLADAVVETQQIHGIDGSPRTSDWASFADIVTFLVGQNPAPSNGREVCHVGRTLLWTSAEISAGRTLLSL